MMWIFMHVFSEEEKIIRRIFFCKKYYFFSHKHGMALNYKIFILLNSYQYLTTSWKISNFLTLNSSNLSHIWIFLNHIFSFMKHFACKNIFYGEIKLFFLVTYFSEVIIFWSIFCNVWNFFFSESYDWIWIISISQD